MQPNSGLDLFEGQPSNNTLDPSNNMANMGRAKSNSLNKTPEIKTQFRKNDAMHGANKINNGNQSFLG